MRPWPMRTGFGLAQGLYAGRTEPVTSLKAWLWQTRLAQRVWMASVGWVVQTRGAGPSPH